MRAFLINPEFQTLQEVDFDGTEAHLHVLLGADRVLELEAQSFDSPEALVDAIYVGDYGPRPEGCLESPDYGFLLDVYAFTGRAVVIGVAEDGSDTDASIQIDELARLIRWARENLLFGTRDVEKRMRRRAEMRANPKPQAWPFPSIARPAPFWAVRPGDSN